MFDVFAAAVANEQPTTDEKVKVIVPVETTGKIAQLTRVRETMEELKTEEALVVDALRPIAEKEFLKLYEKNGARPESFVLQDTDGAKVLFITQDRYTKLTKGTEDTLKQLYPGQEKELIGTETEFKFNPAILMHEVHGPVIQKALSAAVQSMEIPDELKKALIVSKTTKTIKKGTIERMRQFPQWQVLYSLIRPVIQFKNQK